MAELVQTRTNENTRKSISAFILKYNRNDREVAGKKQEGAEDTEQEIL